MLRKTTGEIGFENARASRYMLRYFVMIHFLAKYNIQLLTGSVKVRIFMNILAMSLTDLLNYISFSLPTPIPILECLPDLPLEGIVGSDIKKKQNRNFAQFFFFEIFFNFYFRQ